MIRSLASIYCLHLGSTSRAAYIGAVHHGRGMRLFVNRGIHNTNVLTQIQMDRSIQKDVNFKIKKTNSIGFVNNTTLTGTNVALDDLELSIDGKDLVVNLTWLRDSCHCNKCTHEYSRQRLITAKDFRKNMFSISDLQIAPKSPKKDLHVCSSPMHSDEIFLNVRWADGHESEYSVSWLQYVDGLYAESQLNLSSSSRVKFHYPEDDFYLPTRQNNTKPEYWNVSKLQSKLLPVDYKDLVDGFEFSNDATFINANKIVDMSCKRFEAIKSLSNQLVTLGLAKIVNAPRERNQVLNIARSLAYERPTGYGIVFDVVVEPSEEINLAYSALEFDLHSDLTYRETSPGVQLLHCIRNSIEGGLSYFSDSFRAAQTLQQTNPELFEVLLQYPATFVVRDPYRNMKFRRQQPVISLDFQGNINDVYYSPFMLPPVGFKEDVKLFYLAFDKFTQLLQSRDNKVIAKMDEGDVFIFHNRRVLHGRSAYDALTSSRFLQGCYMDWDEIKSLHEKLHSHEHVDRLGPS